MLQTLEIVCGTDRPSNSRTSGQYFNAHTLTLFSRRCVS